MAMRGSLCVFVLLLVGYSLAMEASFDGLVKDLKDLKETPWNDDDYADKLKDILKVYKSLLKTLPALTKAAEKTPSRKNGNKLNDAIDEFLAAYDGGKLGSGTSLPNQFCCKKRKPNIVLVVADTLGYNDIGYHNPKFYTPFLDALADSGVKLDNYYVDSMSVAFRASLMMGKHFPNTGAMSAIAVGTDHCIPHDEPNLPERLQDAGYSTYYVGKWYMGYSRPSCLPNNRGFDYFYGSYLGYSDHFNFTRNGCIERNHTPPSIYSLDCCRWTSYCDKRCFKGQKRTGLDLFDNGTPDIASTGKFSTELFTEKALDRIQEHNEKYNGDKPFYMTLAFNNPHIPIMAPQKYIDMITEIPDGPLGLFNTERRTVAGMVYAVDRAVEKLVQKLKDEDMWDNTVLVFTTDKGGNRLTTNNWPLRGSKFTYFEGGIRGIGFVASPLLKKCCKDCKINRGLYHVSDWYKTFLALAGGKAGDSGPDSFDIWESINTCSQSPRREILHYLNPTIPRKGVPLYNDTFDTTIRAALRSGDFKLFTGRLERNGGYDGWNAPPEEPTLAPIPHIPDPDKNVYLYNVKVDPLEQNDLSAAMPNKVREMLDRLKQLQPGTKLEPYICPDPMSDPNLHMYSGVPVWNTWLP